MKNYVKSHKVPGFQLRSLRSKFSFNREESDLSQKLHLSYRLHSIRLPKCFSLQRAKSGNFDSLYTVSHSVLASCPTKFFPELFGFYVCVVRCCNQNGCFFCISQKFSGFNRKFKNFNYRITLTSISPRIREQCEL